MKQFASSMTHWLFDCLSCQYFVAAVLLLHYCTLFLNYRLYSSRHRAHQPVTLLRENARPHFMDCLLQLSQIATLMLLQPPLDNSIQVFNGIEIWRVGRPWKYGDLVFLHSFFWWFLNCAREPDRAGRWNLHFKTYLQLLVWENAPMPHDKHLRWQLFSKSKADSRLPITLLTTEILRCSSSILVFVPLQTCATLCCLDFRMNCRILTHPKK